VVICDEKQKHKTLLINKLTLKPVHQKDLLRNFANPKKSAKNSSLCLFAEQIPQILFRL
jgi:hypothetical protein